MPRTRPGDGLVAGASPAGFARASHPGWLIVAACGLILFAVARASRPATPRND